jgi:hypothetical protein
MRNKKNHHHFARALPVDKSASICLDSPCKPTEKKENSVMTNLSIFSERKIRLLGSIGNLSEELQRDIQYMVQLATKLVAAVEEVDLDQKTIDGEAERAISTPAVVSVPPRTHVPKEDLPSRHLRRSRRQSIKKKNRINQLSMANIPTEEKDQLRLQLLRLDRKGDLDEVKQFEDKLRRKYKSFGLKFRSSGLRTHMTGEYRAGFILRLLAGETTQSKKNTLLRELAELYGVDKAVLLKEARAAKS